MQQSLLSSQQKYMNKNPQKYQNFLSQNTKKQMIQPLNDQNNHNPQQQSQPQSQPYSQQLSYKASACEGECILLSIEPIKIIYLKYALYVVLSVMSAGMFALVVYWQRFYYQVRYPKLRRWLYFSDVPASLIRQQCTHFFIENYDNQYTIVERDDVSYYETPNSPSKNSVSFVNRYLRYIVSEESYQVKAIQFNHKMAIAELYSEGAKEFPQTKHIKQTQMKGLCYEQVEALSGCYGPGTMIVDRPNILVLFGREVFRPLYVFIIFSIILWGSTDYEIYAMVIFFTSAVSIAINLYQVKQLNDKIYHMAYYDVPLDVLRQGQQIRNVSSVNVVPGDIVFLKDQIKLPFQGIILEGSALINECALTGQSVPIIKKADQDINSYKIEQRQIDKNAFIYEGTTIIQVNNKKPMNYFQRYRQTFGIAVYVTKTNFSTTKGQLIRIISFPKERENQFQKESTKFLFFLFGLAILSYAFLVIRLSGVVQTLQLVEKLLDLVTITVPPGLPVSMTFGIIYAIEKLKNKDIYCVSPNKIISGGRVNLACFDKTGTLTENYMDFYGLVPCFMTRFYPFIESSQAVQGAFKTEITSVIKKNPLISQALTNMAVNHTIVQIQHTKELVGDPMQIKLFQFGQFELNTSEHNSDVLFSYSSKRGHQGYVYKRFQFDSDVQRMSVIATSSQKQDKSFVYCKGSPQVMKQIMLEKSIPKDYENILKQYASHGFRVLAIASKRISGNIKDISREQAEYELVFDGFQIFQNKLKKETTKAIADLTYAEISCIMITGDNALTASNIAYKCEIADLSKKTIICDFDENTNKFKIQDFQYNTGVGSKSERKKLQNSQSIDLNQSLEQDAAADMLEVVSSTPKEQKQFYEEDINPENSYTTAVKNNYVNSFLAEMAAKIKKQQQGLQFCLTGRAFNRIYPDDHQKHSEIDQGLRKFFFDHVIVFARSKPNDKARVVMTFQNSGNTVLMCGDGVNDCGALKQADVGLSLSQAEASISAPFTSKVLNISASIQLIKECRAGLATNFCLFNIMALYSLIQYTSAIITQLYLSYPSDFQFLYFDLAGNFFFFLTFGYTATIQALTKEIPNKSLFSITNTMQIVTAFIIQILGQASMIWTLQGVLGQQIDYFKVGGYDVNLALYKQNGELLQDTPQTNIIFLFSNFMYVSTLLAFSISKPWRKEFYTNLPFMIILTLSVTYSIMLTVFPGSRLEIFKVSYMTSAQLNWFVLGLAFLFSFVIYAIQKWSLQPLALWLKNKYPNNRYV